MQLCSSLSTLWHCLSLGLEWKHLFQSCGHCWVFQMCWHIECSTFTASSFRIWNSSTGIQSPPLALFVVMLSKAHLTSHFRISGSRSVITPSWLSGSWRSFLYSSSVYSCHLFLISSAEHKEFIFISSLMASEGKVLQLTLCCLEMPSVRQGHTLILKSLSLEEGKGEQQSPLFFLNFK